MSIRSTFPHTATEPHRKENQFVNKHGRKHHNYPQGKAPYPISYDKDVLDSDAMDHHLWRILFDDRPTLMVTPNYPPQRVLDLGCGVGMWTIDAARKWPDTTFVGFDLVNVQFPLNCLEPHVARRISWKHGNFLSNKLPFEDDTFDHVHIVHVSKGVPEHKWSSLFEEVRRVMQPDGFVEIIEEDIIFPVLPRWFTEPLRANGRSNSVRSNTSDSTPASTPAYPSPPLPPPDKAYHEHILLEYLFNSVFESRFINMKPTVVVLGYFTPFFSRCLSAPSLHFSVPFLAPLPPLPEATRPTTQYSGNFEVITTIPDVPSYPITRQSSYSRSLSHSPSSLSLPSLDSSRTLTSLVTDDTEPRTPPVITVPNREVSPVQSNELRAHTPQSPVTHVASWITSSETPTLDNALLAQSIIPVETLSKLGERTRAMNLHHSFMVVLGCRETMWEELKMLQRSHRDVLTDLGWECNLEERESRAKYVELFELFESDMRARMSMWYSMTQLGYTLPRREPLEKAELLEEERRRKAILDARALAREEDFDVPCRIIRVFIGFKEADTIDVFDKPLMRDDELGESLSMHL